MVRSLTLPETLEAPVHSAEKERVLKVIRSSRKPVRAADVSRESGLPVLPVTALLNRIASETGGHLIVDTAGGIAYKFDAGFESAYLLRGTGTLMHRVGRIALNTMLAGIRIFCLVMFFLMRVSFGILLILSVVVIIALILFVVARLLTGGSDDDSGGGFDLGGMFEGNWFQGVSYWTFDWIWDWFYWSRYISWDPSYQERTYPDTSASVPKGKKNNFLDNCFKFLFGYGDPNSGLEETRWTTIARAIQAHGGVVIAENLAPYVAEAAQNEDWMLPVLVRFNGAPEVSETGTIIYCFPEFQRGAIASTSPPASPVSSASPSASADSTKTRDQALENLYARFLSRHGEALAGRKIGESVPACLTEEEWRFCGLTSSELTQIIGFALFALVGSGALMVSTLTLPFLLPFLPVLAGIFVYGLLFAIVPGVRWLVESRINAGIQKRNEARRWHASKLQSVEKDETLQARLSEADLVRASSVAEPVQVAYTTEEDLLDQQFDQDDKPRDVKPVNEQTFAPQPTLQKVEESKKDEDDPGQIIYTPVKQSEPL